jgi:ADP-ribose pyrophosphatase
LARFGDSWEREIMSDAPEPRLLWAGRHLSILSRGQWEYAARNTRRPAVGIVAVTPQRRVVLVEQFRPPANDNLIELPAGLAGDEPGAEHEPLLATAQRELLEETGYRSERWTELGSGFSSPGLTDERVVLFLAEDARKVAEGGGNASEGITIHEVPLDQIHAWLAERASRLDMNLFAGLFLARQALDQRRGGSK